VKINGFKEDVRTRLGRVEGKIKIIIYALAASGVLAGAGVGIKDLVAK
jgi:hypothetical protein